MKLFVIRLQKDTKSVVHVARLNKPSLYFSLPHSLPLALSLSLSLSLTQKSHYSAKVQQLHTDACKQLDVQMESTKTGAVEGTLGQAATALLKKIKYHRFWILVLKANICNENMNNYSSKEQITSTTNAFSINLVLMYLPVFILILCYQKKYRLEKKQQHWPLLKESFPLSHQSIQSTTESFKLNSKAVCTSTGGIADNPSEPAPWPHHPLSWPWHQWQPIDLWLNPSLPVDGLDGVERVGVDAHTALWRDSGHSAFSSGSLCMCRRLKAQAAKVWLLMRSVSRLLLQVNMM